MLKAMDSIESDKSLMTENYQKTKKIPRKFHYSEKLDKNLGWYVGSYGYKSFGLLQENNLELDKFSRII